MARAAAVVVTFSACLVLCSARLVAEGQDLQQLPGSLDLGDVLRTTQDEGYANGVRPMIRVTVWSTSGTSASNAWDLLASAVADPLGWLSTQLDHSSLSQPVAQNPVADLQEMLRKISCARMRQAMMDYYNYQQELNAASSEQRYMDKIMNAMAQAQMHPDQVSTSSDALSSIPADKDDDDGASTASLFEFPMNTEAMEASSRRDDDVNSDDDEVDPFSMPQFSQNLNDADDELSEIQSSSLPTDNALSEKGLKYLSSMLHTISGLLVLQDGSVVSSSNYNSLQQGSNDVDPVSDPFFGGGFTVNGESSDSDNTAAMEPENKMAAEPFSGTEPQVTVGQKLETQTTDAVAAESQPDVAYMESGAADQDAWVDELPSYFTDNGDYLEDDLDFDWGLFAFTLLSALCVVVWVIAVRQYVQLRALFCMPQEQLDEVDSEDALIAPLLAKVHALEVAANHVDDSHELLDTKAALLKAEYCPHN